MCHVFYNGSEAEGRERFKAFLDLSESISYFPVSETNIQ